MFAQKFKLHERQKNHNPGDLRTIALDVTPRCNMKCAHCYAETFAHVQPIELDILQKSLSEAYDLGVFHYVLQGGEPIEDPERLEAIIGMIYPDETYVNVVSNGWKMTRDTIRWLKELQVDKIAYSLDSGISEEHDANRCKGSFDKVMKAIDDTLDEGLLASISIVVTNTSLYSEGFKTAYDFALAKQIRIDVQIAEPVGKWDCKKELLISPEDALFIKQLQINSPLLPNGQRLIHRDIYTGDCDHCPAGTDFMAITADGQLLACNFLQYSLGNIRDKSIKQMRSDLQTSFWFDGKRPNCILGEDEEFFSSFVLPYENSQKPLDAYEVFKLKRQ